MRGGCRLEATTKRRRGVALTPAGARAV